MPIHGHLAWMIMWWSVEIAVFALVGWLVYASFAGRGESKPSPKDDEDQEYERRLKDKAA